jgi:hypothetical protein
MTDYNPFEELEQQLIRWQETLEALECTVAEDRPAANDVALADCFYDAVGEALGWLAEAINAIRGTAQTVALHGDARLAARKLAQAHERMNLLATHHLTQLASCDRITELAELGARRGRQWQRWADAVRRSLAAIPETQRAASTELAAAWQELLSVAAVPAPSLVLNSN